MEILKNVDILSQIDLQIVKGKPSKQDPNPVVVLIQAIDTTKNIVIDEKALVTLNQKITELAISRGLSVVDESHLKYIEEFVGKILIEFYRNGLLVLEDVGEPSDDPYKDFRKMHN